MVLVALSTRSHDTNNYNYLILKPCGANASYRVHVLGSTAKSSGLRFYC